MHDSSLIRHLASFILHVVFAIAVRFPDVDFHAFDRLPLRVFDGADDQTRLTLRVVGDLRAVGLGEGVVRVEGSEDRAFGAGGGFGVVDAVDEEGEAEDVGEENEFLVFFVRVSYMASKSGEV